MRTVPRVPPFDRPATYDDLVKLSDSVVAEIVDGELHSSPRPAPRHAVAGTVLGGIIGPPFHRGHGGPGGWWIVFEPELHLGPDVVIPDIGGWRRRRMARIPETAYFQQAPDWVCEVLSPSTSALDRTKKLKIYARERVAVVWLVDPIAETLEVLQLAQGQWTIVAAHGGHETVCAEPFTELSFPLSDLWA
jgi:Uma2 family endonuclease